MLDGADTERLAGDDNKFGLEELQVAALDDNAYTAAQLRTDVVARCEAASDPVKVEAILGPEGGGRPARRGDRPAGEIDLTDACRVLDEATGTSIPTSRALRCGGVSTALATSRSGPTGSTRPSRWRRPTVWSSPGPTATRC